ncbi:hypothetical protein DH2020_046284 [Rehmannia glutinosa]|uniref:Uncharacterized protein n=1 Tax=Rehmannia glutinosa TaxID=99300 RepID=A0ABR0UBS1_REHGL
MTVEDVLCTSRYLSEKLLTEEVLSSRTLAPRPAFFKFGQEIERTKALYSRRKTTSNRFAPKHTTAHLCLGLGRCSPTSSRPHFAASTEVLDDTDTFRAARTTPARLTPQCPTSSGGENVEKASTSKGKSHKEKTPKPHKSRSWDSGGKDREEPSSKRLRLGSSLDVSGKQPETQADEET